MIDPGIIEELETVQIVHVEGNEENDDFNADDESDFDDEEVHLDPEELDDVASVVSAEVALIIHVQPEAPACTIQIQVYTEFLHHA